MKTNGREEFGRRQRLGLVLTPVALVAMLVLAPAGIESPAWKTAIVAVVMATLWITEAIPISVTALLPLVLLPVFGISDIEAAASPYANSVIYLFLGGFMLARGMERWGLHRRIALMTMMSVGTRPERMVAGVMVATSVISMWVSNTATSIMMLPIGLSVIDTMRRTRDPGEDPRHIENFATCVMLGIAYAASIGGLGTLVGTPPNALFAGFVRETYGISIGFAQWMLIGVPIVIVAIPLTWFLLTRALYPVGNKVQPEAATIIRAELHALGPVSRGEWTVGAVFLATTALWITRPYLQDFIPQLSDAGIAVTAAVALFVIPVNMKRGDFALNWSFAKGVPWEVLVLFGGGLSLAAAITRTGLAGYIGSALSVLDSMPIFVLIAITAAVVCLLSELASNLATAASFLPVAAALAIGVGENPLLVTTATALAASLGFMLPVATPPNAIVFGSGHVSVPQMAKAGLWLDIIGVVLATLAMFLLATWALDIQLGVVPDWAQR